MSYHNIIIDPLPTTVIVGGDEYPINYDFRIGMLFEALIQDPEQSPENKVLGGFNLYFPQVEKEEILENWEGFKDALLLFYRCGNEEPPQNKNNNPRPGGRIRGQIYCFEHDAPYIYSSFWAEYQIDLAQAELHWWKFKALFDGLSEQSKIAKIMSYRNTDLGQIKDKAEKARIARLKSIYALPTVATNEQKVAIAGNIFGRGPRV